ncbi:MAG: hypothetical protein SFU25_11310 [Candidatus Caenarcaniphilales bacterium]|nr:hypothetical protein [Candidatus Caenarcaniphilales bacterium]
MLIARKLFDSFIDSIPSDRKNEIYDLAVIDVEEAMSLMANLYERAFGDYPTGLVASFIFQHLKDKVFQKTHKTAA